MSSRFIKYCGIFALFLLFVFLLPVFSERGSYIGKKIKDIQYIGLQNVPVEDVIQVLKIKPGDFLEEASLNLDIKALFLTGFFSNVIIRGDKNSDGTVTIFFEFKELPRISEIQFLGVEELYPTDLKAVLSFKEGDVYSQQKVIESVRRLKDKYREEGYFLAEVWSKPPVPNPKTNLVEIVYIVDEGESIPIAKINIIGANHLDMQDILGVLDEKEASVLEDGVFQESKYEEDKFKILAFAKTYGFLDAEIDPTGTGYEIRWKNPRKPELGRVVIVTYKLIEGEIRFYGGYSLEHESAGINRELNPPERRIQGPGDLKPIFKAADLLDIMEYSKVNLGEVFDEGKYFRDRGLIQELYSQRGYVFAQVQPMFVNYKLDTDILQKYQNCSKIEKPRNEEEEKCKKEASWIDLEAAQKLLEQAPLKKGVVMRHAHFVVRENGLAYIENIIIKGMVKTQERVIRRELLIKEGQLFNSALVNRSREKVYNLGYFKEVNIQMRPGSDDQKMNLIIDVKEQPTGTISMGGGYGTVSGFSIFTEVGENNLNGTGQRVSGRLEYGPLRRTVSLSWTDPWIYEKCEDTTGSFWRKKQKEFDSAPDLETLLRTADSLQNVYRNYGKNIEEWVKDAGKDNSIETLDLLKVRIRRLFDRYVQKEEECFRNIPRPWALSLSAFFTSSKIRANTITISNDANDIIENSQYDKNRVGVGVGTSHTFMLNWAHYHRYSPSWSIASRPTALVNSNILREVDLGWQFKSSMTHGLVYDNRDNVFSPTSGLRSDLSLEIVGQALGGQDHYNRYNASVRYYHWWFDYTFGGLIRKNALRRWRVVQEFSMTGIFTHETAPFQSSQNKERNPYIEPEQKLYLGGYESLRGYTYFDPLFPQPWRDGASHMVLASTELRFPIEPSILWLAMFFDSGSAYDNVGEFQGDQKSFSQSYRESVSINRARGDTFNNAYYDARDPYTNNKYYFKSYTDWNDPNRAVFSERNVALDRTLYSWGFGLRVQIPVLPLRLFLAQKLYYAGAGSFKPIPGNEKFEFVFGIGDFRY